MQSLTFIGSGVVCSPYCLMMYLTGNKLTETDAVYIRDMMIENTTLKGLNISHNEFTDSGGVLLAEGIGKLFYVY